MQFLSIVITLALGALALAYVLYPFYRRSSKPPAARAGEVVQVAQYPLDAAPGGEQAHKGLAAPLEQADREQAARSALREIELDYQLGNISEGDYRSLRERYVRRALVALKSRYEREQGLDEAIEAQLRQLREKNDNANSK
jgi:hypothetical protein